MDCSIIIVNWNTCGLLRDCLLSIYSNLPQRDIEVLVIDNASSDESVAMVENEFPAVKLIRNEQNTGFASANNQGLLYSTGMYALLLNPDTVVKPLAIEHLIRFMDENPHAGGAGSLLMNPDGSMQASCYPFPTIRRELWRLLHLDRIHTYGVYPMRNWDPHSIREVDHIQGASLILRRKALDEVGLLDNEYFMYSEELDLCYRLKRAGWKNYWIPQSKVVHYGGQSTRQAAEKMFLELYRSKILFFRKNHPRQVLGYKLTLLAAGGFRIALSPLSVFESQEQRAAHRTMTCYYRRLIHEIPGM